MCSPDTFLAILAILFPPIAVWIKIGICSADSLINIALCCLGYIPGLLHAWYIILKYPEADDEYPDGYRPIVGPRHHQGDAEAPRVTYYYISHEQAHPGQQQQQQRSYGTNQEHGPASRAAPPPPVPQKPHAAGVPDQGGSSSSRPEGEHRAPPTYAEAVKGDNKIQS